MILTPAWRITCTVLQVLPLPGVGAIIAGAKNPHSRFMGRGITQSCLVVFGSYPLIIPGAIGILWAWWDAVAIARTLPPGPLSYPTDDADPETLPKVKAKRTSRKL